MRPITFCIAMVLLAGICFAVPKSHTVLLGKWRTVEIHSDSTPDIQQKNIQQKEVQQKNIQPQAAQLVKIRDLIIDGRIREYTTGAVHEITDRLFVARRAYRINDALPDETRKPQQWVWRLGGWISVDRQTGHVAQLNLPAFDGDTSEASWYRDYAAYCGTSDDGSKTYLIVSQLGKRKPMLKKEVSAASCAAPTWERSPSRVTFVAAGEKASFIVHAHSADPQIETAPDTAEEESTQ